MAVERGENVAVPVSVVVVEDEIVPTDMLLGALWPPKGREMADRVSCSCEFCSR